jgi:hypothetical protein
VRIWDVLTGELLKVLEGHTSHVNSVAFSRDDKHIISGSIDNSVRVWDASTSGMLKVLEGKTELVDSAPFSTSGRYIRQKSVDSSGYQPERHTGWLLSLEGQQYLMFIPLAAQLPDSSNILTLPPSYGASVDFTSSTLGPEWRNCFSS